MLYITFKMTEDVLYAVDAYFDTNYEEEWFDDPLVRQMVLDVDKSEVLNGGCIKSPIYGYMPTTKLSGGVKALILMLKTDILIWATACGDNCSKWIVEISKRKDLTVCIEHFMQFPEDFDAVFLDENIEIHTLSEWYDCLFFYLTRE